MAFSRPNREYIGAVKCEMLVLYTAFAFKNEPEPVQRYPSIRARLSTYLYANAGHLKIKLFPKRQKDFREQWSVPRMEWYTNKLGNPAPGILQANAFVIV